MLGQMNARKSMKLPPKFNFKKENIDKTLKVQKYGHRNQVHVRKSSMSGKGIITPQHPSLPTGIV